MSFREWSEDSSGHWRNVGHYKMLVFRADRESRLDPVRYIWRIWCPVKVGSSIVMRLKSGCVSNLSDAKQSCVRAMRKHAKLAGKIQDERP